jgi:hypothetical protein
MVFRVPWNPKDVNRARLLLVLHGDEQIRTVELLEGDSHARPGNLVVMRRRAILWMRVISMASGKVIAGRMVVSRRASIDFPDPREPST